MTSSQSLCRTDLWDNPMGTDGFAFVEFTAPDPALLHTVFTRLGFTRVARHCSLKISVWRQGGVVFLVNVQPDGHAAAFAALHGPSVSGIAFRVEDVDRVLTHARGLGVEAVQTVLGLWALIGVGGSLVYLVPPTMPGDGFLGPQFRSEPDQSLSQQGHGLVAIDHLTHNVHRGKMAEWAAFYARLFNFREVRYFDIEGKLTGLRSQAMTSPDGKIRIPINESADDKSQIEEYLNAYHGEGVQHIALSTSNIVRTVSRMQAAGVPFLTTPDAYYDRLDDRLPGHGLDIGPLRNRGILVDGGPAEGKGLLLQIFTENLLGPVFFEVIERQGNDGFGEGNFKALFESMEQDQVRRGVLN